MMRAPDRDNLRWECADLLYHLLVRMVAEDITPDDIVRRLLEETQPHPSALDGDRAAGIGS